MSDETRDVEALAEIIRYASTRYHPRFDARKKAEAILASDWLAEHDAKVEARVREQIAQAIEAQTKRLWDPETERPIWQKAASIARGGARDV